MDLTQLFNANEIEKPKEAPTEDFREMVFMAVASKIRFGSTRQVTDAVIDALRPWLAEKGIYV